MDGQPPSGDATGLNGNTGGVDSATNGWTWWGAPVPEDDGFSDIATSTMSALGAIPTQVHSALSGMMESSNPDVVVSTPIDMPSLGNVNGTDMMRLSQPANEYMAFFLVTIGELSPFSTLV